MSDELHTDQAQADEAQATEETLTPEQEAAKQAEIEAQVAEPTGEPVGEGQEIKVGETGILEEPAAEGEGESPSDEPIDAVSLDPVSAPPTPPTSPAPSIVQHPVAVEPLSGPVAVTSADRITSPIGKRGKRAADRAARGRQLTP